MSAQAEEVVGGLDGVAQEAVRGLARARGVAEWVVVLAAWLAARYRWSRQERLELPVGAGGSVQVPVTGGMRFGELLEQVSALGAEAAAACGEGAGLAGGAGADGVSVVDAGQWASAFGVLLREAAGCPAARLDELAMLTGAEAAARAAAVNSGCDSFPGLALVHSGFEEAARRWPDAVAVEAAGLRVSYAELDRRANRLAWSLRELGTGPESMVGVCVDRSAELVVALLAVAKAGAAFVPLDRRMPAERVRSIAEDAPLRVIIVQEELRPWLDSLPARLLAVPGGAPQPGEAAAPPGAVALENAAFCYYTSGSTGEPKGVVTDHRCASGRLAWLRQRYPLVPGDRVVHKTPLIFDVAVWEIFGTLAAGATILMADPGAEADVGHLGELLATERTRFVHFVPSMLSAFLDLAPARPYPGLEWVQVSGEAVPAALLDRFAGHFTAEFHNLYGQTETSEVAAWEGRISPSPSRVPIGTQIGLYRLFVLDDALRPVPDGVPGELCVAGVGGLARGYHRQPGLTAERFVPHPYPLRPGERLYRTGDLVVAGPDGTLTHLGRLDQQAKIRGCRVETGEVEAVLSRHPQVRQCAVVARPDGQGISQLVAYVVADGLPVSQLAAHTSRYLPSYMLPEVYVALDALPLTPAGKADRHNLPAPTPADRAARAGSDPPQGLVEQALAGMWQEVLSIDTIGRTDDFFDIGGNSLRCLQVLIRIRAVFDVDVRVSEFFAGPTIRALATSIERAMADLVAGLSDDEAARLLAEPDG